jgi:hypothetical protein
MGASAREIEREIRETRERMDDNLSRLEVRAASGAARYGRIVAVAGVVLAAGIASLILYRRRRRPTWRDRLGDLSVDNLRDLADELSQRLKDGMPSVTVRVNEKVEKEPGTAQAIIRRVAPSLLGTASTALLSRVAAGEAIDSPQARAH